MATYITEMSDSASGPRLAVKDLIDVRGVPTTAGSRAIARDAEVARADAPLMAGARAADCRVVGKANLHELAFGTTGINPFFGTPRNPLDPTRIPGGSSSGSAVAVAEGSAEVAFGSDTGGSIRIPCAFCGVAGLKTTWGRIPLTAVRALAPSLDTVGPMARDVAGVLLGMTLLEPGFTPATGPAHVVGRLRLPTEDVDEDIDAGVDAALAAAGFEVVELAVPSWGAAFSAGSHLLTAEAVAASADVLSDPERRALLSAPVAARLADGAAVTTAELERARSFRDAWQAELSALVSRVEVLALPSVDRYPPTIDDAPGVVFTRLTNPINLAGFPALSLPVPSRRALPASIQLVGVPMGEELLIPTALLLEAAVGASAGS